MRVLQVGLSFNPGGIESFVMNYYRQLVKQDMQFDFICMFPKLAYEEEIRDLGGRIFYTVDGRKHPFKFRQQLREILEGGVYDAVHVNMLSAANIIPLITAKSVRIPKIIAHSHNSSTPGLIRNVLHRINKGCISKYATDYFACSKVAGAWLFPKSILLSPRFRIIHNALDLSTYFYTPSEREGIRRELGVEDRFVIGHVGRFEEQKNHEFLIETFHDVAQKRGDVTLLLVGDGELRADALEKVQAYGLEKQVKFLGIRKDMPRIWSAMDLFIFPSLFEGLPLVAMEAQAAGVDSIMSDSITREVKITDQVEFLPLNKGHEYWAEQILSHIGTNSSGMDKQTIQHRFSEAGYNIVDAAEKLKAFYVD